MTTDTNYYANTAYDSTNKRTLEPLKRDKMGFAERNQRKNRLTIPDCQCKEFLASPLSILSVQALKDFNEAEIQKIRGEKVHEHLQWATFKNKKELVSSIVFVSLWFWLFGGIFGGALISIPFGFDEAWLYTMLIGFVAPFSVWWFGRLAIKRGWVKDGNNIMLNRRTGMISYPRDGQMQSLPFDEFDPYYIDMTSPNGISSKVLRLMHRYSDNSVGYPGSLYQDHSPPLAWEYLQRYMDISQPLPDIPTFDFVREFDPVTAAYDKKYHRPTEYWKNLDLDAVKKMEDAANKAAEQFPWGKTREQAIESGWQPSGVGEGDWRKSTKDDKNDAA